MRKLLFLVSGVMLVLTPSLRAADDPQKIIDRAIKAYGAEQLESQSALTKTKGTLDLLGGINFTQELSILQPDKFKESMDMEIMGQKISTMTVYDGKNAWITANGKEVPVNDTLLKEIKEAANLFKLARLLRLKSKDDYTLSLLGEAQVNGKPAEGVKIASKGFRDVNIYFDKATGLTAKVERTTLDNMTQQEVSEERIILEYQEVDGHKVPKKVLVNRNGKKFMEAEVVEYKPNAKLEASDFAKP